VREDIMIFDEDFKRLSDNDKQWFYSLSDKESKNKQKNFWKKCSPEGTKIDKKKKSRISPIQETKKYALTGDGYKRNLGT